MRPATVDVADNTLRCFAGFLVTAHPEIVGFVLDNLSGDSLRLRVAHYRHHAATWIADEPPRPLNQLETWANERGHFLFLLDSRHSLQPVEGEPVSMRLPPVLVRGREVVRSIV